MNRQAVNLFGHNPGDPLGHLVWIAPWFALAAALISLGTPASSAVRSSEA